ncbi:MAG: 3-methyladenine DNA glycosylase AlkC [Myxococcota bacterium]
MSAFKDHIDATAVGLLSDAFGLDAAFVHAAMDGLDALELKARVRHVAAALRDSLPADWPGAVAAIRDAAQHPQPAVDSTAGALLWWPVLQLVEAHGPADQQVCLELLRELTPRFSAEFAVRPFLDNDPVGSLAVLRTWLDDPDVHVRRLASEGTRPRLPWGIRLRAFQHDPSWTIPLLDALYRDRELYVRRSVANHLGDIAKDHVDLAVATAERWLAHPAPTTDWVIRHALRHPIKQGHAGALRLIGVQPLRGVRTRLTVRSPTVPLGSALEVELELVSEATVDQDVLVDLAVHFLKKDGSLRPKVFKWTRRRLTAGETLTLSKSLPLRPVSTRRHYPGQQRVGALVNGVEQHSAPFLLTT